MYSSPAEGEVFLAKNILFILRQLSTHDILLPRNISSQRNVFRQENHMHIMPSSSEQYLENMLSKYAPRDPDPEFSGADHDPDHVPDRDPKQLLLSLLVDHLHHPQRCTIRDQPSPVDHPAVSIASTRMDPVSLIQGHQ
jgi:uncharacterized protein (DUF58 family)